jgi:hypothetical protein
MTSYNTHFIQPVTRTSFKSISCHTFYNMNIDAAYEDSNKHVAKASKSMLALSRHTTSFADGRLRMSEHFFAILDRRCRIVRNACLSANDFECESIKIALRYSGAFALPNLLAMIMTMNKGIINSPI